MELLLYCVFAVPTMNTITMPTRLPHFVVEMLPAYKINKNRYGNKRPPEYFRCNVFGVLEIQIC